MKYLILTLVALLACVAVGILLMNLLRRVTGRPKSLPARIVTALLCTLLALAGVGAAYLGNYYHADQTALAALDGDGTVAVSSVDGILRFDGPGEQTALLFMPGAKVEAKAYAPLMLAIAQGGVDCFVVSPPANIAFLGEGKLGECQEANAYEHWILGGHSLGGVVASSYASDHPQQVDGLVLLASYAPGPIDERIKVCSIYGTEDGVLNRELYEEAKARLPQGSIEKLLQGCNHAGFGSYGPQRGDGEATISAQEQQAQTAQAILELAASLDQQPQDQQPLEQQPQDQQLPEQQ